jgi:hypothetical protein
MPLNKSIVRPDGFTVTYWRETILTINAKENTLWCALDGYLDANAYQTGKTPAESRGFTTTLPGDYLTRTATQLAVVIRDYIKTTPEFEGATNAA